MQTQQSELGFYNILIGDTAWRFGSALSIAYNNNVNPGGGGGAESDVTLAPSISALIHWPISVQNSVDVSIAAGYTTYLIHSGDDGFYINPGSGLSFNVFLGKVKINFHDRINITQYTYENPGISSSSGNVVSLGNTVGAVAYLDVDKGQFSAGYDHNTYVPLVSNAFTPASGSENFYAGAGYHFIPQLLSGIEAGASIIDAGTGGNPTNTTPSATQYSLGVFGSSQITQYIGARLDIGYQIYNSGSIGTNGTTGSSGIYFSGSINHRLNRWLSYTLTAARSTDLATYGQPQSSTSFSWTPMWNLINKFPISTPISWRESTQVGTIDGRTPPDYDQFMAGVTVSHPITQKLGASVNYQFIDQLATKGGVGYTDFIISLSFGYQF